MANKVFSILKLAFKALAVALAVLGCFFALITSITIDGTTGIPATQVFLIQVLNIDGTLAMIAMFVGGLLIFSKKQTAEIIGYGLFLGPIAIILSTVFQMVTSETEYVLGIGSILEIIAAACVVLAIACKLLVDLLLSPAYKNAQLESRVATIKEYKKLLEEGIISEEEYEGKRAELIGIHKNETAK